MGKKRRSSGGLIADPTELELEFWRRKDPTYLLRKHGQRRLIEFLEAYIESHPDDAGPLVGNCHRRLGKTHGLLIWAVKRLLGEPGHIVRYGAPTEKQCRQFVIPALRKILARVPPGIVRWRRVGTTWYFRHQDWPSDAVDSELVLFGCKEGADAQRGMAADTVILDEARDIPDLMYVIRDVFGWQFVGRQNPLMVVISTPPKGTTHSFKIHLVDHAQREGRYLRIRTKDNLDWTPRDDRMLERFCGGKHTSAWRREADCEFIADVSLLIVPQWTRTVNGIDNWARSRFFREWPRPPYYYHYTFVDTAFAIDWTGILFAYVDFIQRKLIIEAEKLFKKGVSSGDLAEAILQGEEEHFGEKKEIGRKKAPFPVQRIGDVTPQQVEDLRRHHGCSIRPAEKWDREAAVSNLQTGIGLGKVIINPRCEQLDFQLVNGIRDEKGDFMKDELLGHCDLIAALVYGFRLVNFNTNPYPQQETNQFDGWLSQGMTEDDGKPKHGEIRITHQPLQVNRNSIPGAKRTRGRR